MLTLPRARLRLPFDNLAGLGSGEGRENRPRSRHCDRRNAVSQDALPHRRRWHSSRERVRLCAPLFSWGFFIGGNRIDENQIKTQRVRCSAGALACATLCRFRQNTRRQERLCCNGVFRADLIKDRPSKLDRTSGAKALVF